MTSTRLRRFFATCILCFGILQALTVGPARAEDPWFTVDSLNTGLAAPLPASDLRTPRAVMQTFLDAAAEKDWSRASRTLDLADVAPEAQAARGPLLAQQLYSVIDRKAVLDWSALNGRPDGLQVLGSQQEVQAGEPRRSLLLRELDLDPVPSAIRLTRVKAGEDGDPVWMFDRGTVADVPALFARYGPSEFESSLPPVLLGDAFWGLMWWELIGLPVLVLVAGLVWVGLSRAVTTLAARADRPITSRIISAVNTPLRIAIVTWLVWLFTNDVFVFSGQIDIFLAPAIAIGFVTAALLLIVNVIEAALDHLVAPGDDIDLTMSERQDARTMATKLNAAKRILVIVVFLLGAGVVLSTADLFRSFGISLLASAGALTLVLGFAARDVLSNIMASLQIAMNQSARVGDRIVYKGELCHVERIHMTYVQLRDWDGTRVIVPVEQFVSETFSNWSLQDPAMLRILKFKLAPTADVSKLRDVFMAILDEVSDTDLGEELGEREDASVNVAGQDVFGVDVWFSVPCADPNTSWEVACTIRERLIVEARKIEEASDAPVFPDVTPAEAA